MSLPNIEILDTDGAIRDAEAAVAGDTRSAFFRKAAVGGGAVLSSGAIMAMLPDLAMARKSTKQDIEILNFAYTLELLEAAFYEEAIRKADLSGDDLKLTRLLRSHEATHVSALKATIRQFGGKPISPPKFDFRGTTSDRKKFIDTAYVLENTGVSAYLGQATRIKSDALLAAAASIVTIEARHAAAIAVLRGSSPFNESDNSVTPDGAFDRARSMKRILKALDQTNFIKGF